MPVKINPAIYESTRQGDGGFTFGAGISSVMYDGVYLQSPDPIAALKANQPTVFASAVKSGEIPANDPHIDTPALSTKTITNVTTTAPTTQTGATSGNPVISGLSSQVQNIFSNSNSVLLVALAVLAVIVVGNL